MLLGRRMLLLGGSGRRLSTTTGAGGAAAAAGGQLEEQLGAIPLAFPAVCMWGSNTGVGKTLFSAGLAAACRRAGVSWQHEPNFILPGCPKQLPHLQLPVSALCWSAHFQPPSQAANFLLSHCSCRFST